MRPSLGRLFVVVGVFDGLHLGHAYLLHRLREEAIRRAARSAVITFDHHPDEVLVGAAPPLLCDPEERLELLASAGVDVTVIQPFNETVRRIEFDAFVSMMAARVDLAGFLMTPDAAFGFERRGTPDALTELGRRMNFDVVVVPPFELDGRPVRSSEIRAAIAAGDLPIAQRLLGRRFSVIGEATPGADGESLVTFALPVALPSAGSYAASVTAPDGRGRTCQVVVEVAAVRVPVEARGRTRIEFE
jgi:riboflavin kinase/FMN adenylyltransferase